MIPHLKEIFKNLFSAYFCVRRRSPRTSSGGTSSSSVTVQPNQLHMQQHRSGTGKAFSSVEYSTNNANVTIRETVSISFFLIYLGDLP